MLKRFHIISTDDWQGLYVNGKLISEGHKLSLQNLLNEVLIEGETFTYGGLSEHYVDYDEEDGSEYMGIFSSGNCQKFVVENEDKTFSYSNNKPL